MSPRDDVQPGRLDRTGLNERHHEYYLVRTTLADDPWVQLNLFNWHLVAGQPTTGTDSAGQGVRAPVEHCG
ncbi:hypothetical protein GCM10010178_89820 [Lentzea flava]|uniref:Uncharacterized protein n=1 Tax=Lentzea flava TaxID=103732 RepID=A0ABQ2VGV9_9PSEU|nr:hypothetical protein GCM10010178_89820 [Lentzea flava]